MTFMFIFWLVYLSSSYFSYSLPWYNDFLEIVGKYTLKKDTLWDSWFHGIWIQFYRGRVIRGRRGVLPYVHRPCIMKCCLFYNRSLMIHHHCYFWLYMYLYLWHT